MERTKPGVRGEHRKVRLLGVVLIKILNDTSNTFVVVHASRLHKNCWFAHPFLAVMPASLFSSLMCVLDGLRGVTNFSRPFTKGRMNQIIDSKLALFAPIKLTIVTAAKAFPQVAEAELRSFTGHKEFSLNSPFLTHDEAPPSDRPSPPAVRAASRPRPP